MSLDPKRIIGAAEAIQQEGGGLWACVVVDADQIPNLLLAVASGDDEARGHAGAIDIVLKNLAAAPEDNPPTCFMCDVAILSSDVAGGFVILHAADIAKPTTHLAGPVCRNCIRAPDLQDRLSKVLAEMGDFRAAPPVHHTPGHA